jgi:hemin uptake protein HemP
MSQKPTNPLVVANDDAPRTAPHGARQAHLDSRVLFAGGSEVVIFHYGEAYQLRQTRLGKLILTK